MATNNCGVGNSENYVEVPVTGSSGQKYDLFLSIDDYQRALQDNVFREQLIMEAEKVNGISETSKNQDEQKTKNVYKKLQLADCADNVYDLYVSEADHTRAMNDTAFATHLLNGHIQELESRR